MINTIELHTDGCIMNCVGCPSADTHTYSKEKDIDENVLQSFLAFQSKVNELQIKVGIQYNMPITSLRDLHIHITKKELIDQIGFACKLEEDNQKWFAILQKLNYFISHIHTNTVGVIVTQKDKFLTGDQVQYIIDFADQFVNLARKGGLGKIGISLMKNMFHDVDRRSLYDERTKIENQLIHVLGVNDFVTGMSTKVVTNESSGPGDIFNMENYDIKFTDQVMDFGLYKRVVSLSSYEDKKVTKDMIKNWYGAAKNAIVDNPNKYRLSHIALYPKDVWLEHDPFHNFGGKEYFTVSHQQFQDFIKKLTKKDVKKGAINFAYLFKEHNLNLDRQNV